MNALPYEYPPSSSPVLPFADSSVVEVPLLLPAPQVSALEAEANRHGLTVSEVLRHLVQEFVTLARAERAPSSDRWRS